MSESVRPGVSAGRSVCPNQSDLIFSLVGRESFRVLVSTCPFQRGSLPRDPFVRDKCDVVLSCIDQNAEQPGWYFVCFLGVGSWYVALFA